MPDSSWRLVLPVKHADLAKSRLRPPGGLARPDLARAFALDTLEAVCAALPAAVVVLVSNDPVVAAAAAGLGARVEPDPGAGLNGAVRLGLSVLPGHLPRAVLLGDLPSLTPADLRAALDQCWRHPRAVVPDADGTGTVLVTASSGRSLEPAFGVGSAARHGTDGAQILDLGLPRLRRDVDDAAGLVDAVRLGVGRHTAQLLARLAAVDGVS